MGGQESYDNAMKIMILLVLFSTQVLGQNTWLSNKDHSEILFQVPYLSVSELTGRFNDFKVSAILDDKTKAPSQVDIEIQASSVDTSNKLRDGHLKGADFFNANLYPVIKFKSSKIEKLKANHFRAHGFLVIKNVSRDSQIDFEVTPVVNDTWGFENVFVKFRSKLNRKQFNIKWNKTLDEEKYLVGDEVTYWGVFQLQPNDGKTPPSKHMIPDTDYIREREKLLRKEEESGFSQKLRKLINGN